MYRVKNIKERSNGELTLPVLMDLIREEMSVFKSLSEKIYDGPKLTDADNLKFLRDRTVIVTDKCQALLDQIADHLGMIDSN